MLPEPFSSAGEAETEKTSDQPDDIFFQEYIHNHLEIGSRSLGYSLKDKSKGEPFNGSYIGSLNEIHEHQNYAPFNVYGQYKFSPYGGVGVAYDQFEVGTGSTPDGEEGGDGQFELQGIYLYLLGAIENSSRFTPYAELGLAFYGVDFVAKEGWSDGGRKAINPGNATGVAFAVGCDVQLSAQWSLDLYLRSMSIDVDVENVFEDKLQATGTFDLSHYDYGLGVKFSF